MSVMHKIGEICFNHKKIVIGAWAALFIAVGAIGLTQQKELSNAITIPGTPAQEALDEVSQEFPSIGQGQGRVVFNVEGDVSNFLTDIDELASDIETVKGVSGVITPSLNPSAISDDKTTAFVDIQMNQARGSVSVDTIEEIQKEVEAFDSKHPNIQTERGGDIVSVAPEEIIGIGEAAGVLLALMVLVITLGALVAAGMPILIAIVSVGVSMGILFGLSSVIDITMTTPVLAVMLGLAVGIDYSLFIITKYRKYLKQGRTYSVAVSSAIATAGNAVVFAALTVIIALAALSIVNVPFMTIMGLVGAGTIAVAALAAITLLPALLGFAGNKIVEPKHREAIAKSQKNPKSHTATIDKKSIWHKLGDAITNHPFIVIVGCLVLVGSMAWPAKYLELGLPTDQYAAEDTTQRKAYDILEKSFGPGFNGPLIVLVEGVEPVSSEAVADVRGQAMQKLQLEVDRQTNLQQQKISQMMANASSPQEMAQIQSVIAEKTAEGKKKKNAAIQEINKKIELYKKFGNVLPIVESIEKDDRVSSATPAVVSDDGKTALVQVISTAAPASDQTAALIHDLRSKDGAFSSIDQSLQVTGSAALQLDINEKLAGALPVYLSVIVGLSFILLMVAFRSILIPIKATLGFLMSLAAMMGFIVAVFQWGWFGISDTTGPIVSFIPIIGMGILFGLAMDYEFFLVSGMHEAYGRTKDAKHAVADGFSLGAKVVMAAGLIMVSIFAAFVFSPDKTIQSIGLGLAVGIAIDAFIVRMLFVTAVMQLLGKSAWWLPKWMGRFIPKVSIDGKE